MLLAITATVFLAIFILTALAVVGTWLVTQPRQPAAVSGGSDLFKEESLSSITAWEQVLERFRFTDRFRDQLAQADLPTWSVGRLTMMMLLGFAIGLVLFSAISWMPWWLSTFFAGVAGFLPYAYILRRRTKRLDAFEEQLPDALELLARSLRAGHPFAVSMEFLARDNTPPISTEFRIACDEHRLGASWENSLAHLASRVPLIHVRLFVAAVLLQSRTGGKLGEVLSQLAETIREAQSLKGEIRALAAHGRITGNVLTILPIAIAILLAMVTPGYLEVLTGNPTGRVLLIIALIALAAAHFIIKKIVEIRV